MLSLLALHDYDIVIIITIIILYYYVHPTFLITVQSLYHLEPIVRIKYKILHCNDLLYELEDKSCTLMSLLLQLCITMETVCLM